MDDIIILIPAYKPNEEIMMDFINELVKKFNKVVVVNDGSGSKYDEFFKKIESMNIKILRHDVNKGKGRAIKTGFEYILKNYNNITGTVTADCDGQHSVEDIIKCANALRKNKNALIVGCRNFDEDHVPTKSKYGNKLTRGIFKVFIGINITDTQSGLRAFGTELMSKFLKTVGERYEYETNMLIDCKTYDIEIKEVTIKTIYIRNNEESHFNPIKDSLRIYKLFFKYILAATSSFILDILLFSIFVRLINIENNIMISTIIARILSSIYNFVVNSRLVFKKQSKTSIIKYLILVIVQMFVSGTSVTIIAKYVKISSSIIKIFVDTLIFIANFFIQREWVFKK